MKSDFEILLTFDLGMNARYNARPVDGAYFDWVFDEIAEHAPDRFVLLYRANLAGAVFYRSQVFKPWDETCAVRSEPLMDYLRIAEMMKRCDPMAEAVRAARERDLPIYVWLNWCEFHAVRQNALRLVDDYWCERPRKYWTTRDGSRFYHGIPVFGDPEVKTRLLAMLREVSDYGPDGVYLSSRTHSAQPGYPIAGSQDDCQDVAFGFDDVVVEEYRSRYGVDIRYRDFDHELWHRVKGDHFTQLILESGRFLHERGQTFVVGIPPDRWSLVPGDSHAHRSCRLYKDWETWVAEGGVDGLCAEQPTIRDRNERVDIQLFKDTTPPGTKIYPWCPAIWFVNKGGPPFSIVNWENRTVDELRSELTAMRDQGAAGVVVHELYRHLFIDTAGRDIGMGQPPPMREYWDALKL